MKIYLMRHSETDWNRLKKIQGQSDIQLNANGLKIARLAGEGMKDIAIDVCFSSPLIRALETAGVVLSQNTHFSKIGANVRLDPRLMEANFGEWEGKVCEFGEGKLDRDEYNSFFRAEPDSFLPKGAEPIISIVSRTSEFLDEICNDPLLQDKNILVVSHGCAIKCMMKRFSKVNNYFEVPRVLYNCEVSILSKEAGEPLKLDKTGLLYYDKSLAEDLYQNAGGD